MTVNQIIILVVVILVLGIIVFPLINRRQFINLEPNQQIRLIMKEAKGLVYFKNVSKGSTGVLFYVKNKRKKLFLNVYQKNTRAISFYQREDFKIQCSGIDDATGEKDYLMTWQQK